MHTIAEGDASATVPSLLDDLARLREPITIMRDGHDAAVLLSAAEYASIQETLHLLSTPANTERIRQGLADHAAGKAQSGELCD
jgi:antitoxin YefM